MNAAPDWKLVYEGFDPEQEGLREALCTLGNGFFATRGAGEEAVADDVHYPGTYHAGGYNRLLTQIAGRTVENEDLVNLPNWLPLTFRPHDGDWLNLQRDNILSYRQELDMRQGVLSRQFRVRDKAGRETSIASRRLVSMADPHVAAIEISIQPENWSGEAELQSALDGRVINAGVARYRQLNSSHLRPLDACPADQDGILLVVETSQSRLRVAEAARMRVFHDGHLAAAERQTCVEESYIAQNVVVALAEGEALKVEKVIGLFTGRDDAISEPALAATELIAHVGGFDELLVESSRAWRALWDRCDIALEGAARIQMIMRLHIFHLLQTVSPHTTDLDVGVPARGLHGEAYRGHIFWDELFILPFLNYRVPEISRSLLLYRYRRLDRARRAAQEKGLNGALYPWQSGSDGREESQVVHLNPRSGHWTPDNTHLQYHVNAAVAFNVWRYYEATGRRDFLESHGAEMFVEIARLWSGLATFNPKMRRYEIRGVVGPDEFHDRYPWSESPGLVNNAYTNVMAAWVLKQAAAVLGIVSRDRRKELEDLLRLGDAEVTHWDEVSRKLHVPFHSHGVISQFDDYDRLEELDWAAYRAKYGNIMRLDRILEAEGDTVNRYKASKQADVLMLFYLFSLGELRELFGRLDYPFDAETIRKAIDYYLPRTSDGSTLSNVVHSWVLARSDRQRSWQLLKEALESDIGDVQGGTTAEGIHLGAMAGTIDLVQRGQTAFEISDGVLHINPCLPEELQGMRMHFRYRGARLRLDVGCDKVAVSAPEEWREPKKIGVRNQIYDFAAGDHLEFPCRLEEDGWRPARKKGAAAKVKSRLGH